jgi:hypothetical protein
MRSTAGVGPLLAVRTASSWLVPVDKTHPLEVSYVERGPVTTRVIVPKSTLKTLRCTYGYLRSSLKNRRGMIAN